MIHGLFFCAGSQGKFSLMIKLGAGAYQENMTPGRKVFDRRLEFHPFFTGNSFLYHFQLVCVSAMRKFLRWFQMILEAGVKGLQEMFKSSFCRSY